MWAPVGLPEFLQGYVIHFQIDYDEYYTCKAKGREEDIRTRIDTIHED